MKGRILQILLGCSAALAAVRADDGWLVRPSGEELRIFRTRPGDSPYQVAALHRNSSYFRLAPAPRSGWGTSAVVSPTFWSHGRLHQGAIVDTDWESQGENLRLQLRGSLHTVVFVTDLLIAPPRRDAMHVDVRGWLEGDAHLPEENVEAFKPVFLSSMRVSDDDWDASQVMVEGRKASLPRQGFALPNYVKSSSFGVRGGSSRWKRDAPSMWVELDQPLHVQAWVTESRDPNDDNVGMWAGSPQLMTHWSYKLMASLETGETDAPLADAATSTP